MSSRMDGILAMSRGTSGGKQVIKFANTSNPGRVYLILSKQDDDFIVLQNVRIEF